MAGGPRAVSLSRFRLPIGGAPSTAGSQGPSPRQPVTTSQSSVRCHHTSATSPGNEHQAALGLHDSCTGCRSVGREPSVPVSGGTRPLPCASAPRGAPDRLRSRPTTAAQSRSLRRRARRAALTSGSHAGCPATLVQRDCTGYGLWSK